MRIRKALLLFIKKGFIEKESLKDKSDWIQMDIENDLLYEQLFDKWNEFKKRGEPVDLQALKKHIPPYLKGSETDSWLFPNTLIWEELMKNPIFESRSISK